MVRPLRVFASAPSEDAMNNRGDLQGWVAASELMGQVCHAAKVDLRASAYAVFYATVRDSRVSTFVV